MKYRCEDCDYYVLIEKSSGMAFCGDLKYWREHICEKTGVNKSGSDAICEHFTREQQINNRIDSLTHPNHYDLGA